MSDLVEWLRAQLDEDEQAARDATAGPWAVGGESVLTQRGSELTMVGVEERWVAGVWPEPRADAAHIARHDPARVLRQVAAHRRILAAWEKQRQEDDPYVYLAGDVLLRALASIYADRPGYNPAWAPDVTDPDSHHPAPDER